METKQVDKNQTAALLNYAQDTCIPNIPGDIFSQGTYKSDSLLSRKALRSESR